MIYSFEAVFHSLKTQLVLVPTYRSTSSTRSENPSHCSVRFAGIASQTSKALVVARVEALEAKVGIVEPRMPSRRS